MIARAKQVPPAKTIVGVALDPAANAAGKPLISRPDSRAGYGIPTDEELMIARHTLALLAKRGTQRVVSENVAG